MLAALGATDAEDCVYRYLVTAVSVTAEEVGDATGLPRPEARDALSGLVQRGLAYRLMDGPERYAAASPGTVEAMISNRLTELRAAQETLDGIVSRYRANHLVREAAGVFEIVRGHEALRQHSLHLLQSARFEALNMIKPPIIALQSEERAQPDERVAGRLIFETEAIEAHGALDAIRQGLRSRDEIRVHTKLPTKMLVIDRTVALVPLAHGDTTPVGVLIYKSAVLDAFIALFDYVWATAVRLHVDNVNSPAPAETSVLSAEDRHLLSLLLSGLTDEAIAAHFGISVRTVQRKVHALMDAASVRTRMQLAWEAARQGWM